MCIQCFHLWLSFLSVESGFPTVGSARLVNGDKRKYPIPYTICKKKSITQFSRRSSSSPQGLSLWLWFTLRVLVTARRPARQVIPLNVRKPASLLHLGIALHDLRVGGHVGAPVDLALASARRRDEDVEPLGHDEAEEDEDQGDVADAEAHDVKGVVAEQVEVRVRKAEDDGESRGGDVSEDDGPESGDVPVLPLADDEIEITTQLVA